MSPQQLNGQVPTQTSLMALRHRRDGGRRGPLLELGRLGPLLCDNSRGAGRRIELPLRRRGESCRADQR
jgi:hypothetical protein